ncbi:hypothetical protein [Streptobacillus canis]|uniref:hypothetical protein n=1 Tax=Streptobacillus canis TaxID=2678686 RepID=UPI0012E28911|nr:hypothetical protein [Streptobacillus canis]
MKKMFLILSLIGMFGYSNTIRDVEEVKFINAYIDTDTSITDRIDENVYVNIDVTKWLNSNRMGTQGFNDFAPELNIGVNGSIKDVKLGAFAGYQNENAHQVQVGLNVKYKEYKGFVRYRAALKELALNHNVDVYNKYEKDIQVLEDLTITPGVGLLVGISSPSKVSKARSLTTGFNVSGDIDTKIKYDIKKIDASLITKPYGSIGYAQQAVYENQSPNNKIKIGELIFKYGIDLTFDKHFNKFGLSTSLGAGGNHKGAFNIKAGIGMKYDWE